jgi:hypothetical protein
MVIYAQRIRYGMGTLGVASGMSAVHGPAGQPRVQGACLIAPAWLRRQESSALRATVMPTALTATALTATALTATALPVHTANTLKRDAFAGVSPGLRSMEPPV